MPSRPNPLPAAAALLAFALTGCSTLAPPAGPGSPIVAVPAAWTEAAASAGPATALAGWWQRFDDPQLGRFVADALAANSSVQTAQAALRQARALREVQAAGLLPSIGGSASAQRSQSGNGSAGNSFSAGFDASWEPDLFGGKRSGLNASDADAQASAASLGDVQVSVAAEVAVTYIQWRGAQARLAIAQDNLASQLDTLQITQWRQQAGLATSLDTEQARSAAEQTRAALPTLTTSVAQNAHALAVLTGRAPGTLPVDGAAASGRIPQPADDLALSLPAETLRQRPDVRAAERQVSAALARVSQADAARYPSFQLGGSLGLQALTLGALGGGGALASSLLASVSAPLFDGGAAKSQVAAQQAALQQAQSKHRATVLTALQDVEDALVALRGDRERLARLRSAAEAAGNAALLARQRYASGLVDFQTVLDTQRTQLGTQDSVASTATDLSADHVRLYKALGGGWQPDADTGTSS